MEADPRRLLAQLAVAVIAADGRVTTSELEAVARLDDLGLGRLSALVEEELRSATHRRIDLGATCRLLRERVPDAAPVILAALAQLAASDRALAESELALLGQAASGLGLSSADAQEILSSVLSGPAPSPAPAAAPATPQPPAPGVAPPVGQALALLGLDASARRAELDERYRQLVARYDPAKVIDLGPDFAALAIRKLGELTDAYEVVADALSSQT
jgi:DnaJ-domain-containing protein 1